MACLLIKQVSFNFVENVQLIEAPGQTAGLYYEQQVLKTRVQLKAVRLREEMRKKRQI